MLYLSLLLACGTTPPALTAVRPDQGPPGTALVISGESFSNGTTARLGRHPLADVQLIDPAHIQARVADDTPAGTYDLVLTAPSGQSAMLNDAFELIVIVEDADPCDGPRIISQIPPTGEVVKIDRHGPGDTVVHTRIKTQSIQRVELEYRTMKTGGICSAVYLRTRDGRHHLFDSDASQDLQSQAQRIAIGLGKPIDVVVDERVTDKP